MATPFAHDEAIMANVTSKEITLESVARYAQETNDHLTELQGWLDILWLLLGAYIVFFMQVRASDTCASLLIIKWFILKDEPLLESPDAHICSMYDPNNSLTHSPCAMLTAPERSFWLEMQAGFALLETGSVRAKNTKNILLKVFKECH